MKATRSRATSALIALVVAWLLGYYGGLAVERWPDVPVSMISVAVVLLLLRWLMSDLEKER